MNGTVINLVGQIFGVFAIFLGFSSYQMKTSKKLLIVHLATCGVFAIHYLLIGALPACLLNATGVIRNIVYFKKPHNKIYPVIFAIIMAILGVLSWQNIYSLLIILGLVINTACLSMKNPQHIRISLLVSCPIVLIYDILVLSVGGIVFETVSIISAIIGIVRERKSSK